MASDIKKILRLEAISQYGPYVKRALGMSAGTLGIVMLVHGGLVAQCADDPALG